MKAATKTPKIPVVESLLAVMLVAILGFTGWYVLQAKQSANDALNQVDKSSAEPLPTAVSPLSVSRAKLPAGWRITDRSGQIVTLTSDTKRCTTTVTTNQLSGQSGSRSLGASQFTVQTVDGTEAVPATITKLGSGQAARYQSAGSLEGSAGQTNITATCNSQNDLTAAGSALQAVTINQQ